MRAEDLHLVVRHDQHLPLRGAVHPGAIVPLEIPVEDAHPLLAVGLARFFRGHADVRQLRVGERGPGNEAGRILRARVEHVADDGSGLRAGAVGEEKPAGGIADSVDRFHAAAQLLIDHDAARPALHADALQAERLDVRLAAGGDEDLAGA